MLHGISFRVIVPYLLLAFLVLSTVLPSDSVAYAQGNGSPYGGTAVNIPGTVQAENYNTGGQNVAYNDIEATNNGNQYRTTEGVDIEATTDTGGGHNIGWTAAGEWTKYTVNVTTTGTYTLTFRVASAVAGGSFHLEVDGVNVTGALAVPNTGGWQVWQNITRTGVNITAGSRVLRLVQDVGGGNFNWFSITGGAVPTNTPTRTATRTPTRTNTPGGSDGSPYGGTAPNLPGTVQAENYNTGGQNVAYNDIEATNNGSQYRTTEGVDIEATTDTGGGYNVGWTAVGEWTKYTVNVTTTGTYTLTFRVASAQAGGSFHLEVDGVNVTGALAVPNTGGWQVWQNVTRTGVNLTAGQRVLRLVQDAAGGNFNWFSVSTGTVPTNTPTPVATSSAGCTSPADCLSKMTLDEKIGQMTQANKNALTNIADIRTYYLGSLLSGGGEGPSGSGGTATQWADMYDSFQAQAVQTRLKIPLIYGVDAVHGHNNVFGAVVFPHHIGLGATRNLALVQQTEEVTRDEVLGTGIDWAFAPCICVPRDDRWGRTYEGYSEDTALVSQMGAASIKGFQGTGLSANTVAATAKHYVGDGGTTNGTDQGNTQLTEAELRAIHLEPYKAAIANNVATVMASYSSWNGTKMHGHQYLLTTVLKNELGFQGFVISDWAAIDQLPGDYASDVRTSINAGVDMVMVPSDYRTFITTLRNEINAGNIPMSRIDDAVRRILTIKFDLDLFTQPYTNRTYTSQVGSAAHRAVARQAVRESLVLLKNANTTLPLSKTATYRLIVGGSHINDIGLQSGGWTISWQGSGGNITTGTTLLQAIQQTVSTSVTIQNVGTNTGGTYSGDVGIVAIGENPYAEGAGDSSTLGISAANAQQVSDICSRVTKCVVILFSGRPLIINTQLSQTEAFVAAWLPGTEGRGITDVLFGDFGFVGKLPMTWPNAVSQEPINLGDGKTGLFPFGFGINPF